MMTNEHHSYFDFDDDIFFCTVSRRALVCESSHSLCGLSRHAQFGVVVLRLLFELLRSVCESLNSRLCFELSCSRPPHMKRRFQQMHTCQGKYQVRNVLICFNCNKPGHLAKDFWNRNQNFIKHAKSVQCFTCHKFGHTSRECWHRIDNLVHAPIVDTSPSLQKTQLPDWDSVSTQSQAESTQSQAVSTLVPGSVDTSLSSQKNSFAEMGQCVDTLPGGVDTLQMKLKIMILSGHKLQAILSRGRTWESRGISGEKLAVLGKGADPTEEAQEKKNLWHFRCHQSRASLIEKNLHRFPSRLLN
ncbi:hypothetical protein Taro_014052 [Colocasia esculenta]|uniref:CCHC-type domain-containing protein n=1 Tax=Colocasia esculenta TaxID=4460 RepID=A0A843UH78_COLES|nr:hypothetical protein [Colocasia esculenta]